MINNKAQNVTEFAMLYGLVIATLVSLTLYFTGGVRALIKDPIDAVGYLGQMPDTIASLPINADAKEELRKRYIQEVGIEENYNPLRPYEAASSEEVRQFWSKESSESNMRKRTWEGGEHQIDYGDKTHLEESHSEFSSRIEYDQVTH